MYPLRIVAVAVLGLAPVAGADRALGQPLPGDYAILGQERTSLRVGVRVTGAAGTVAGTLVLGNHVQVNGSVAADVVRLGSDAGAGRFFCRFVILSRGGGVVGGPVVGGGSLPACRAFTPPLVDPTLLAPIAVVPGATDLRVPGRTGSAPMPAASYRDVVVGRGALLQLAGGSYAARSIRVAPTGRVVCVDTCRIGVLERVVLAPRAELGAGAPLRANRVRVDVAASTGRRAFRAGARAATAATIFAPSGTLVLGPRGSYRGAFIGRTITVGPSATLREDSAFGS
ncbi:MAG: hypothetical protein E6J79_15485 [Deltaproteobacteria bacterium]|nr:MAG: hypothetical protein E6J79_15485 [Deltaproteobacteria bacterium]